MTNNKKLDRLESWALMAAEALQEFCDEAQEAAGDPDGEGELPTVRALLRDLDDIVLDDWVQLIRDEKGGNIDALGD